MKTIGLVTYRELPKLTPSDQLLVAPLEQEGFHAIAVPWDDSRTDWNQFDLLVLRSCWNYHKHYDQFKTWLSFIEKEHIPIWNPVSLIRWNSNKKYLLDLQKRGIPIVPTIINTKQQPAELETLMADHTWNDVVVKPAVGASAYNVFRVKLNDAQRMQRQFTDLLAQTDMIVQPFMKEIVEGEFSLIFIGRTFSHAAIKIPKWGDFRANYELGATEKKITPDRFLIKGASNILQSIPHKTLYARIDGITVNGKFILMELELVEPHLFFDFDSDSPVRFAKAVAAFAR